MMEIQGFVFWVVNAKLTCDYVFTWPLKLKLALWGIEAED